MKRKIQCDSGLMGWQDRLRKVYGSHGEFVSYDSIYNIARRIGFDCTEEAWDANPVIQGSTNPKDLRASRPEEYQPKKKMKKPTGQYRTQDGRAQIQWELESKPQGLALSMSGDLMLPDGQRASCQCRESIQKAYPDDPMVQRLCAVWRDWHNNYLNVGCQHQKALGWGHGHDVALVVKSATPAQIGSLTRLLKAKTAKKRAARIEEMLREIRDGQNTAISAWKKLYRGLSTGPSTYDIDHLRDAARRILAGDVKFPSPHGGGPSHASAKLVQPLLDWVNVEVDRAFPIEIQNWIYENSIGAPCPECGYLYGTEWKFEPIPPEVLEEIESWGRLPQPEGSLHEAQVKAFLKKWGCDITAELSNTRKPDWEHHGHHYIITVTRLDGPLHGKSIQFDFFDSQAAREEGRPLEIASVVGCMAGDIHVEEKFEDFCGDYGYDQDSIKALRLHERCVEQMKKLKGIFPEPELQEELQTLRD